KKRKIYRRHLFRRSDSACKDIGPITRGSNSRNCAGPDSFFMIFLPLLHTRLLTTLPEIRDVSQDCKRYSYPECSDKSLFHRQFVNSPPVIIKDKRKYIFDQF